MHLASPRARTAIVVTAAAVIGGLAAYAPAEASPASPTGAAAITTAFKFNPGLKLLDDNGANTGAAEPSLDVDTPGNVYVTGPEGVPTGGCPFSTVHPGTFNAKGMPYDYRGRFDIDHGGVGGGDCDVTHGARSTLPPGNNADNVAVSSLSLANLTTNTSQDRGKTFMDPANNTSEQVFGVDRQWLVADRDLKTTYQTVHDVATANIQVSVSYDGGFQYVQNTPAINGTTLLAANGDNHFSTTVVDTKTHKLYIAFVAPRDQASNDAVNSGGEDAVYVAVGDVCAVTCPKGGPIGPISWTDYKLYQTPVGHEGEDLAHIFPIIAIDKGDPRTGLNKNVYIAWSGDTKSSATNRIQMLHFKTSAADPSTAASSPIYVDDGSNHSNMFPWLVAGRKGVVDAAWYSGKTMGNGATCPTGATGSPDDSNGVNNNCFNQWHVTFAQVTGAGGTSPVVTRSLASGINHKGSICDQGLNCSLFGGDRSLLDFFDMDLDPAGGANIAYVQDTGQTVYTRQCFGKSATTGFTINRGCGPLAPTPPALPGTVCNGSTAVPDGSNDAVNPPGAGNNGSTDARNVGFALSGSTVDITETISTLQDPAIPPPGTSDIYYYVTWKAPNGKQYAVEHDEPQAPGAKTYQFGEFDPSNNQMTGMSSATITGSYNAGSPGTIVWHVPKTLFGNPTIPVTSGTPAVGKPYSVVIVGEGALGTGLVFVQPADRAPNSGSGSSWQVCP